MTTAICTATASLQPARPASSLAELDGKPFVWVGAPWPMTLSDDGSDMLIAFQHVKGCTEDHVTLATGEARCTFTPMEDIEAGVYTSTDGTVERVVRVDPRPSHEPEYGPGEFAPVAAAAELADQWITSAEWETVPVAVPVFRVKDFVTQPFEVKAGASATEPGLARISWFPKFQLALVYVSAGSDVHHVTAKALLEAELVDTTYEPGSGWNWTVRYQPDESVPACPTWCDYPDVCAEDFRSSGSTDHRSYGVAVENDDVTITVQRYAFEEPKDRPLLPTDERLHIEVESKAFAFPGSSDPVTVTGVLNKAEAHKLIAALSTVLDELPE